LVSIQLPTHKLLNRWRSAGIVDTTRQRRRDRQRLRFTGHQAVAGLRPRRSVEMQIREMRRWVRTPPRLLWQRATIMPDVALRASIRDGHVIVALCEDLDVTGAGAAEADITAPATRGQRLTRR
jgi:hypothetical protein